MAETHRILRERAVRMGMVTQENVEAIPIEIIRNMVEHAERTGIPPDTHHPPPPARLDVSAILRQFLKLCAELNGNGTELPDCCHFCYAKAPHIRAQCVCHAARAYLEETDGLGV